MTNRVDFKAKKKKKVSRGKGSGVEGEKGYSQW